MTRRHSTLRLAGLAAALCISVLATTATAAENEVELWLSAQFSAELSDHIQLGVSQGLRWDQDLGRLHEVLPAVGLTWCGIPHFRPAVGYRFEAVHNKDLAWEYGHRLTADARTWFDVGPLELSYRLRVQAARDSDPAIDYWAPTWRNRLQVEYEDLGDLTPYASTEVFVGLGQPDGFGIGRWRVRVGADYDFGQHEVGVFYMAQRRVGDRRAVRHDVIGLGYEFNL